MKVSKTYPKYLTDHIKFFYSVFASEFEKLNTTHTRLPDGTLDIVINLGGPVMVSRDGASFSEMPSAVLTGLHQDRSFLRYKGEVDFIGAVFKPGSANLFVNDNLDHYKSCNIEASLIFGKDTHVLVDQLKHLSCEKERHHLLELFLFNNLKNKNNKPCFSKVPGIVQSIHSAEGNIEISELHKKYFMSERTLRRTFSECVGMSPKQYASIIRIKSFSKRYEVERSTYSNILNELGYTDQSHFNKEFQKIAGTSPTAYFSQLNKIGTEFIHLI